MCARNRLKLIAFYSAILITINVLSLLFRVPAHISLITNLVLIGFGMYEIMDF